MKKSLSFMRLLAVLFILLLPAAVFASVSEGNESFTAQIGQELSLSFGYLDAAYEDMTAEISGRSNCGILGSMKAQIFRGKSTYSLFVNCCPVTNGTARFTITFRYTDDGVPQTMIRHTTVVVEEPAPESIAGTWKINVSPAFKAGQKLSASAVTAANSSVAVSNVTYAIGSTAKKASYAAKAGDKITLDITLTPAAGYVFGSTSKQSAQVNGASAKLVTSECSEEQLVVRATLTVGSTLPSITKNPTGESVDEGGSCSFIARADNADSVSWYLTDGEDDILVSRASRYFDGIKYSLSDNDQKLKLSNIPAELDGWSAYAVFYNDDGEAVTEEAYIEVNYEYEPVVRKTATPKPQYTYAPYQTPKETYYYNPIYTPTPVPTAEPVWETPIPAAATETPAAHTHQYSVTKSYNDQQHYNECSCGERTNLENHTMIWGQESNGRQAGVCSVCGYTAVRNVSTAAKNAKSSGCLGWILLVLIALLVLVLVIAIIYLRKGR